MSQVSTPMDRRFRRARVKPSRRRWPKGLGLRALKFVVLPAVCLFVLGRLWMSVVGASTLRVRNIAVVGNGRLPTGQVTALLEGLSGEPILSADLVRWRERLLASPWVADAHLRRRLPSTIVVNIAERTPIAIARFGGELYLIDEHGVVMGEYGPEYGDLDLPVVNGLGVVRDGSATDRTRVDLAARVIESVKAAPALAKRLSEVNVSDEHNAAVILTGDRALLHVGTDHFVPRLVAYNDMSAAIRQRVPEIDSVDLRFEDRMFVRPVGNPRSSDETSTGDARPARAKPAPGRTKAGRKP